MPLPNIDYGPGQDQMDEIFDKTNDAIDAVNEFSAGTAGQIWTKDSVTDFDGSFKAAETVINSGLPSRTGKSEYLLRVKTNESGYEVFYPFSDNAAINVAGPLITISSSSYATLNNGGGSSLEVVLPNDGVSRKFFIIGKAEYENGVGETSIIMTRIYDGTSTLIEDQKDLRAVQDDCGIQTLATLTCTGQTISLQAKKSAGNNFSFNGGNISVIGIF